MTKTAAGMLRKRQADKAAGIGRAPFREATRLYDPFMTVVMNPHGQALEAPLASIAHLSNIEGRRSVTLPDKMYGHRARIGYTSPPLTTEIFPYEFYKIVPAGVTLVVTSLAIVVRSKDEVDQSYDVSMRAAREMAAAGCDIVCLGGVPINLSRGAANAEQMIVDLEQELGVKVSSSTAAQARAAKMLGCRRRPCWHSPIVHADTTASGGDLWRQFRRARSWARPAGAARSTRSGASRSTPPSRWAAS